MTAADDISLVLVGFPSGDASAQVAFIARYLGPYADDLAAQERLRGKHCGGYDEIRLAAWQIAERHHAMAEVGYRAGNMAWEHAMLRADHLLDRLRFRCVPLIRERRSPQEIRWAAHAVCKNDGIHVLDGDLFAYLKPIADRLSGNRHGR